MSNALYDSGRNAFLKGEINFIDDTIKMALVSSNHVPDLSNHTFYSSISGDVVGTPQTIQNKTAVAGVANSDDVDFGAIATGSTINYILLYKDTGTAGTSPLIALYDTATGIPFATSGSEVTIKIDNGANKLFKL
jgi:hypothetical protein